MNKSAIIFDMDGVLIDSEPLWREAQIESIAEYGKTVTVEDCIQHTMGKRVDAIAQTWCDFCELTCDPKVLEHAIVTKLCALIADHGQPLPGVVDILECAQRKNYRIGLATSSSYEIVDAVMSKLGVSTYFNVICSADDEPYGKPHPSVYLTAAKKLGVAPKECLVIEDSLNGLIAAKAATMTTYLVSEYFAQPKFSFADEKMATLNDAVTYL